MGWKPIVVGVDGSAESVRAADAAARLAERARADCALVYALPDYLASFTSPDTALAVSGLEGQALERAREFITDMLKGVRQATLANLHIEIGPAPIVLADAIQKLDASMLVLGGKHHHGIDRIAGSTVTHMARTVDVPLLVTDGGRQEIGRVLAAVDVSYAASATIREAERIARVFGAKLRVLHVVEPMPVIPGVPLVIDDEDYYRGEAGVLESNVWPKVTMAGAEKMIRRGRAAAVIADEVAQWGADLLVVGSHGKGWVDRLLMGSTSERLLRILPTTTLMVPVAKPVRSALGAVAMPWEASVAGEAARP